MTTIKEIAKLSGCSVSTVSRVINHHPYVSVEKVTAEICQITARHQYYKS
ncbi:LacI family DNA-binding transcriptional regulator [Lactobacillus sp. ESL0679]|nr:LacI family DNA-binding transcriptional regulator [Lactobacillus sp. ESL0679]MDF7682396.1 LacI family DNA-binding transcriptional regulator [Lactobacillus sp. ESL0679]